MIDNGLTEVFQFTPLREGRQPPLTQRRKPSKFQFTPLREGRLGAMLKSMGIADISIHAPPRGATKRDKRRRSNGCISIHAPPRGATRVVATDPTKGIFQFTPLREGRRRR